MSVRMFLECLISDTMDQMIKNKTKKQKKATVYPFTLTNAAHLIY